MVTAAAIDGYLQNKPDSGASIVIVHFCRISVVVVIVVIAAIIVCLFDCCVVLEGQAY